MTNYVSNSYSVKGYATTNSFAQPKAATFRSTNELDPVMPSLTQGAIGVSKALTSLLQENSPSWNNNPIYEAPVLTWNNNPIYEAPRHSATATKDSAVSAVSKSINNAPAAKLSDEELAWKLQQEEFEFAYGRKVDNKAELVKTLQVEEDSYFAKALQAKEEQKANEYAIAKLLQEDADLALARILQTEEDSYFAKALQAKEDADFALQLQQEEIANYFSGFATPIQSYNYNEVPAIGNDFTGYNFMVDVTA